MIYLKMSVSDNDVMLSSTLRPRPRRGMEECQGQRQTQDSDCAQRWAEARTVKVLLRREVAGLLGLSPLAA